MYTKWSAPAESPLCLRTFLDLWFVPAVFEIISQLLAPRSPHPRPFPLRPIYLQHSRYILVLRPSAEYATRDHCSAEVRLRWIL